MNQDDIIRWAREAELVEWLPNSTFSDGRWWIDAHEPDDSLERFAALVYEAGAEAEREMFAKACDEASRPIYIAEVTMPDPDEHNKVYPGFIASEIRARKNK
jgi:hypothetical protein